MKTKNPNSVSNYNIIFFAIFILCFALLVSYAKSNDTKENIVLPKTEFENIGKEFQWYKQTNGRHSIEEIVSGIHNNLFSKQRNHVGIGNSKDTYWFKTNLSSNPEFSDKKILEIPFSLLDECNIWFLDKNVKILAHYLTGAKVPFNDRPIKSNRFAVPIPTDNPSDIEIVVAINTTSIVNFSPMIWSEDAWQDNQSFLSKWYGLLFGAMVTLILYNLVLAGALKDISYLYYVIYLLGLSLYCAASAGLLDRYVWPDLGDFSSRSALFLIAFAALFDFLFINRFLEVKSRFPKAWKLSRIMMLIVIPASLPELFGFTSLGVLNSILILIVVAISFVGIVFYLVLAFLAYGQGMKQARFFIIAFSAFIISYVTYQLYSFQWIEYNPILIHALEAGSLLEGILLSLALADRINILTTEKKSAEMKAIVMNRKFTREFILSQEIEKESFSSALHDSTGHGLLVLKQNLINLAKQKSNCLDPAWTNNELKALAIQCKNMFDEVAKMSQDLHPSILERLSLPKALKETVAEACEANHTQHDIDIDHISGAMSREKQNTVYKTIQEGLNNIFKHAKATKITLTAKEVAKDIYFTLSDNGCGMILPRPTYSGIGLTNMEGRIKLFGGQFSLESKIGKGTRITFSIPITEDVIVANNIDPVAI